MVAIYELLFFLLTSIPMVGDKDKKQRAMRNPATVKPIYIVALIAWLYFIFCVSVLYNQA
jgi:hypothetical protein